MINIGQYIETVINWMMVHFSTFFDAINAAIGILFAPEKGEDTRHKIAEILRKKGIRLNRNEMENLVDEIAAELKGEANE